MSREEQGCRAGRKPPREQRLAERDQWRSEHRTRLQKELAAKYAA